MDEVAILTVRVDKRYPNLLRPADRVRDDSGDLLRAQEAIPGPVVQEYCCWRPG